MTGGNGNSAEPGLEISPEYLASAQSNLSVDQRITLARKEGARGGSETGVEADPTVLRHILHIIALDAEVRVRQAPADTLAENPSAPRDVVLRLAQDDDLVAAPLLRLSEILTADDLVAIIESQASAQKMAAIADRSVVHESVCLSLIKCGNEDVASRLLQNPGADIPEPGLVRITERYGEQKRIQVGLIDRKALPATIMERLVALVTSDLLTRMVERHKVPVAVASKIALETRSHATLGLTTGLSLEAMSDVIEQLSNEGRFSDSILLRSLCVGNLEFVIHVIASRAQLGLDYVRSRITQANPSELEALWKKADLPAKLLPVIRAAIDILRDSQLDGAKWGVAHYRQRIIERMITGYSDLDAVFDDEDIAFLAAAATGKAADSDDFIPSDTGAKV